MKVYAGTDGEKATEIHGFGESIGQAAENYFGGIFASEDREIAESHGKNIQEFSINNLVDVDDLRSEVFYGEGYDKAKEAVKYHIHWADDDEIDHLIDVALGAEASEQTAEILKEDSVAEADWRCQGLAGVIALAFGADAVYLPDEHGASILVLPGAEIVA